MAKELKTKRLIIVDDEEMVITSIKNFLLLETDYEVLAFTSPVEALAEIKLKPVSLAISDFLMPGMDGIEFLKEVKKCCPYATLMLLTGYADKENAIKAINEIGIYKYIEKPWDNEDLKINIDNAYERTELIIALQNKVNELNMAQLELQKYNEKLEDIVKDRTKELTYANAELNAIIESSADGILTLNEDFVVTSSNPAFIKLKNSSKKMIINKNINDLILSQKGALIKDNRLNDIYINNDCFLFSEFLGNNIPVSLSIAPIVTEVKQVKHDYVVVVRDITSQKETERLREDFIATLTHDLRTPLLAAIQTLNFFLDGTLGDISEKQAKFLDTMRISNKDMLGLVNALLEVYKYESGELVLVKDYFNIVDLVKACIEEIKPLLAKKNQNLKEIMPADDIKVFADKKELRRVLANYLGNAMNYTPVGGNITVELLIESSKIKLLVSDTGRGIPPSDIKKLFQRFSQGTSKQRSTGTGLGLYLSRQIIEAHSGKVWANSQENIGSTFGFSLPIKEVEDNNE